MKLPFASFLILLAGVFGETLYAPIADAHLRGADTKASPCERITASTAMVAPWKDLKILSKDLSARDSLRIAIADRRFRELKSFDVPSRVGALKDGTQFQLLGHVEEGRLNVTAAEIGCSFLTGQEENKSKSISVAQKNPGFETVSHVDLPSGYTVAIVKSTAKLSQLYVWPTKMADRCKLLATIPDDVTGFSAEASIDAPFAGISLFRQEDGAILWQNLLLYQG